MLNDHLIGKALGEFSIQERVGRGGMATVYRAHQPSVHRDVALKVLLLEDGMDENFRRRFEQEAELIASLEHIHILPIYGYGIQADVAYIAMRLLRGGTLADQMKDGPLPLERAVDLFSQIAQGLAHAHNKGIIHRDLKPANILLDENGHAYLTDFGLAKLMHADENMTRSGNIVGTPSYMSPEQLRGEKLDHRSDVYSLGVMLYQMLTGRRPFEGDSSDVVSIIYNHLEKMPQRPGTHNPDIPRDVENVVMRALAKKPDDRFGSVGEMAARLQEVTGIRSASTFPTPAVDFTSSIRLRQRTRQRQRFLAAALVTGLLALVVTGVLLLTRHEPETFPQGVILDDQKGTEDVAIASPDELALVRRRLGSTGFIAIISCNLTSEYHATVTREMRDFADADQIPTRVYNADNDEYRQLTLIETARLEGAKGFILCPLDATILHPVLVGLEEAHFPLVLPATGDQARNYGGIIVNTDNYLLGLLPGQIAGRYIRDELGGQANVIILDYPDLPEIVQRADGLEAGIREFAPEATIIGRYTGAVREVGETSVSRLLADGVAFNVIASINDAGSYGAIQALEAAGIPPTDVAIFSVDAEGLAQQYIREAYYLRASVEVARTAYARAAVGLVIRQLAGATLPRVVILPPGEVVTAQVLAQREGAVRVITPQPQSQPQP